MGFFIQRVAKPEKVMKYLSALALRKANEKSKPKLKGNSLWRRERVDLGKPMRRGVVNSHLPALKAI